MARLEVRLADSTMPMEGRVEVRRNSSEPWYELAIVIVFDVLKGTPFIFLTLASMYVIFCGCAILVQARR